MGWKPIHFGLAGMMLIFGSFNTLSVKWADTMKRWALILCNLCENNFWPLLSFSESVDGTMKHFNHPFLQVSLTNLSPQLWTCSYRALLTRPVVCSWARCSAWWPSGSRPATEDGDQREVPMLILVQRKHSQGRSAPWSSFLLRSVIWPQPPFNTSVSPSPMRLRSRCFTQPK